MTYETYTGSGEPDTNLAVLAMLNNLVREAAENLGEINFKYKTMCEEYGKLEKALEGFRERVGHITITEEEFELDIPFKAVCEWMETHSVKDRNTGKKTSLSKLCLADTLKAREEKLNANIKAAAELQKEIRQQKEIAEKNLS